MLGAFKMASCLHYCSISLYATIAFCKPIAHIHPPHDWGDDFTGLKKCFSWWSKLINVLISALLSRVRSSRFVNCITAIISDFFCNWQEKPFHIQRVWRNWLILQQIVTWMGWVVDLDLYPACEGKGWVSCSSNSTKWSCLLNSLVDPLVWIQIPPIWLI